MGERTDRGPDRAEAERSLYIARLQPPTIDRKAPRAERLEAGRRHRAEVRRAIERWIAQHELTDQIRMLPEGNQFDVLLLETGPIGTRHLTEMPYVVELAEAHDFPIEIT